MFITLFCVVCSFVCGVVANQRVRVSLPEVRSVSDSKSLYVQDCWFEKIHHLPDVADEIAAVAAPFALWYNERY